MGRKYKPRAKQVEQDLRLEGDPMEQWKVYLAGEIHSDWRDTIRAGADAADMPVTFLDPILDHAHSDECGVHILGPEDSLFWADHKGAKVNAIRTRTFIRHADIVVVRFGNKYKQWNAAFDAGQAVALGKPLIVLHDPELNHALKEIDGAALATATEAEQVVNLMDYVIQGRLM
jgi:YtoQ family protein